MFIKILRSFVVCVLFFSTKICPAFSYDIEPHLINNNLRLAAMGNLDLVIEDFSNELNAYDFGQSPAGVIEDDYGTSYFYLPGLCGFTVFGDTVYDNKWSGYGFSLSGVFKVKSKFAIGGSYTTTNADYEARYDGFLDRTYHYDNYYDTLIIGYQFIPQFTAGFRGSYVKYTESGYDIHMFAYEPSIVIRPLKTDWEFVLNYRLRRYDDYWTTHGFALPILFVSKNFTFGLKPYLETQPYISAIKAIEFRSLYQIPMEKRQVNLGLILKGATYYSSDRYYYIYAHEWALCTGVGVAYIDNNIGLLGIQYKIDIIKELENHPAIYRHNLNCGAEISVFHNIDVRVGFSRLFLENGYYLPSYNIITSGIGVKIPCIMLRIDVAHNLKFMNYGGYDSYDSYVDKDHIFALSGRVVL